MKTTLREPLIEDGWRGLGSSKNIKEAIETAQVRGDGGRAGQVLSFQICVLPIFRCLNGEVSGMVIGQ